MQLRDSISNYKPTVKVTLAVSVIDLQWRAWSADVSTAFLQGLPQERKLWLKLPGEALRILGATADTRMYPRKPVYGQLDAPRRWYLEAVSKTLDGSNMHLILAASASMTTTRGQALLWLECCACMLMTC